MLLHTYKGQQGSWRFLYASEAFGDESRCDSAAALQDQGMLGAQYLYLSFEVRTSEGHDGGHHSDPSAATTAG